MRDRSFSVILLPTAQCNVACDYCFEHKDPLRLSAEQVELLTERLLDHMDWEDIAECEIYWQGGEALLMGPSWYLETKAIMETAAAKRGRQFVHYLQTKLRRNTPRTDVRTVEQAKKLQILHQLHLQLNFQIHFYILSVV